LSALIDTHCHLNLDVFDDDLPAVLRRAEEAGIEKIIVPGVDVETSQKAVALSERHPAIFAAVGIHPNDLESFEESAWKTITGLANHPRVVAIGEIGLDYYRNPHTRGQQKELLHRQLEFAKTIRKPVIIHNRDAPEDLLAILSAWQEELSAQGNPLAERPGVMHSFDGDLSLAEQFMKKSFFISLSGPVTFKNAPERQEFARQISLERLVVETDSPYLAPHPHRGRRNEPAYVKLIAEKISGLQEKNLDFVSEITTRNADTLFLWRSSD
jgi:TatD DNase family protein